MPAFLKLDGVDGEYSHGDSYDGWIELESVASPVKRTVNTGVNLGAWGAGTTKFSDIQVSCKADGSFPTLVKNCADGKVHTTAEIHLCESKDNKNRAYAQMKLKNVIITDCGFAGTGDAARKATVGLGLAFTEIEWIAEKVDKAGQPIGKVSKSYTLIK